MFSVFLDEATTVANQTALNALLGTDRVYLSEGGQATLCGEVTFGPGVVLGGRIRIVGPTRIDTGCSLTNVELGPRCTVRAHSVLSDIKAGAGNIFGPFCFIRDHCVVADDSILGAHLEACRSEFASGVKISHRAFIGDAKLGCGTIIGAGTIFCNYTSAGHRPITIGAGAIIGSGTMLVAPLTIGDGAIVGAGSVITKDVSVGARIVQKR